MTRLGAFRMLAYIAFAACGHALFALFSPLKATAMSIGMCRAVSETFGEAVARLK